METLRWIVSCTALAGCVYWIVVLIGLARTIRGVPVLAERSPRDPERWPSVSVIVPACNEADGLEAAMRTKLAQDYPSLEVVLIDDRSSDGTGAIVDAIAARDARVKPVHVTALPDGWLGKLNAMQRGVERSKGEWLLFSDADIHFAPWLLRRAIAWCEERGVDHLALFPSVLPEWFALDAAMASFARILLVGGRVWAANDPASRVALGVGAFNLVRRSAMERTGGFEWLKLEVADDVGLGQMLKRSGARSEVVNGRGCAELHFYSTVGGMVRASERMAVFLRFSALRVVAAAALVGALELGPFVGVVAARDAWLRILCGVVAAAGMAAAGWFNRWLGHAAWPGACTPVGSAITVWAMAKGGVVAARRGGLEWRGTVYGARALMDGSRVEFG